MKDLRLYSWFDVETTLAKARTAPDFPEEIKSVRVFDSAVELTVVVERDVALVNTVLGILFGPRYDEANRWIILESASAAPLRTLPVEVIIDPSAGDLKVQHLMTHPSFARMSVLPDEPSVLEPRVLPHPFPEGSPRIMAFYSYKGGVGRTLHLIAALKALIERKRQRPSVLVIDADLEAPGLTWWVREKAGLADISFLDFLAMAHYEEDLTETIAFVAQRIRQQTVTVMTDEGEVDLFFLPTFRDEEQVFRIPLRPEHLVQKAGREWIVGDLIARLGKQLGVGAVLVDLRAGVSELSSPMLFDPRLARTLVTTTSSQSVQGTQLVLKQVRKVSPLSAEEENYFDPGVIVSMVPQELVDTVVPRIIETMLTAYQIFDDGTTATARLGIDTSTFAQELLHIEDLESAFKKLTGTAPQRAMERLMNAWIPAETFDLPAVTIKGRNKARRLLADTADRLVVAESGSGTDFLRTASLKALGLRFQYEMPVAVVMGAKGSGKTFAYLQVARRRHWSKFLAEFRNGEPELWGHVLPLTQPLNLEPPAVAILDAARRETLLAVGGGTPASQSEIEDAIRKQLLDDTATESTWRHFWLGLIARSLGIGEPLGDPIAYLQGALEKSRTNVVVILDGLEDIFPGFSTTSQQQMALRSLCQDVPNALRRVPGQRLGLLVFLRKDIVRAVLTQNFTQFESLYSKFELRWNPEEALRLAVWVCQQAGLDSYPHLTDDLVTAPTESLEKAMVGIWGLKLGKPMSREAATSDWVRDALSDFKGQLQARDVIRFLHFAAEEALKREEYDGRLIQPSAIRRAVQPTSTRKIEEIKIEIKRLEEMFAKFAKPNYGQRAIPFTPDQFGLDATETNFLDEVGVILEHEDMYYMPEIFRSGLGFGLAGGARPKVISLMRKALGIH
jgi:MinD-like ATPase involved in chromosome partitioning or flagellar assembly